MITKKRITELCSKIFSTTHIGNFYQIDNIESFPTSKFCDNSGEWLPYSHSIYMSVRKINIDEECPTIHEITTTLEGITGMEFCIDIQ
jgi:hypothetical protein